MEKTSLFKTIDLQAIADFLFNNKAEQTPEFIRESEMMIVESLHRYTKDVTQKGDLDLAEMVENQAGPFLDAVSKANYMYLENGMKLGAQLIMQLMGCI